MNILSLPTSFNTPLPFKDEFNPSLLQSGAVFSHENGITFTLIMVKNGSVLGLMRIKNNLRVCVIRSLLDLHQLGFKLDIQNLEALIETRKKGINYSAVRILPDGSLVAITQLIATCAIVTNWDDIMAYESRYCFSNTDTLGSYTVALCWLSLFDSAESRPIGNVAYRGRLGDSCITTEEETNTYYDTLYRIMNHFEIDQPTIFELAAQTNNSILNPLFESPLKFSSIDSNKIDKLVLN